MKKSQVEHVLRAASRICDDQEFVIIGSQSLHGKYPDLADDMMTSFEVDLIAKNRPGNTDFLNTIGMDSQFHEEFGYYADPVDEKTAVLPRKWKERLVHLKLDSGAVKFKAYCLEPHDLVIAKLAAGREKDRIFIRELLRHDLVKRDVIIKRLGQTPVPQGRRDAMETLLRVIEAME